MRACTNTQRERKHHLVNLYPKYAWRLPATEREIDDVIAAQPIQTNAQSSRTVLLDAR